MWIQLNVKYELRGTGHFDKRIGKIKDRQTHAWVLWRLDKLIIGAFGDCKAIRTNLFELRMFFGSGYRVYYTIQAKK